MYDVYINTILLPVTPEKIQIKINNQNKTMTLINQSEINMLKQAGLTDISFSALIPQFKYPFAKYIFGFKPAKYYLDAIEKLKTSQKPFQFIVSRHKPGGGKLFSSNITVSLEDYSITEDAKNGFDITVDFNLKQWADYGTKTFVIPAAALGAASNTANTQTEQTPPANPTTPPSSSNAWRNNTKQNAVKLVQVAPVVQRPSQTAPNNIAVTTKVGDTYESIAKSELGDVTKANEVYETNKSAVQNIQENSGETKTKRDIPPNIQLQIARTEGVR